VQKVLQRNYEPSRRSVAGSATVTKQPGISIAEYRALQAQQSHASTKNMQALGRLPTGTMNKTEAAYAQLLEIRKFAGEILWYEFEAIRLRLAKNTFYTPDFFLLTAGGQLQVHEVKGFWKDDARVKIKMAASLFPFQFMAVTQRPKKAGGGFLFEKFLLTWVLFWRCWGCGGGTGIPHT
jgi:hypothetical protein